MYYILIHTGNIIIMSASVYGNELDCGDSNVREDKVVYRQCVICNRETMYSIYDDNGKYSLCEECNNARYNKKFSIDSKKLDRTLISLAEKYELSRNRTPRDVEVIVRNIIYY